MQLSAFAQDSQFFFAKVHDRAIQAALMATFHGMQNTEAGGERKSLLGNDVNYYRQLYLDNSGKPGDLRLSEVTTGDKYAQGSMYVHQRL